MAVSDFNRCIVCGKDNPIGLHLNITEGEGWAKAEWTVHEHFVGFDTILHGGIQCAILDDLMAHATYYLDADVMTAHLEVDYKAPAYVGDFLECEAHVIERGTGRSVKMAGTLKKGDTIIAEAKSVMVMLKRQ